MLDESLRWLIANGKLDQAKKVIKTACKWNKKDYATVMAAGGFYDGELTQVSGNIDEPSKDPPDVVRKETAGPDDSELCGDIDLDMNAEKETFVNNTPKLPKVIVKKYTAIDILRNVRVLRVSLILWFTW